jgi:hypothetical protein
MTMRMSKCVGAGLLTAVLAGGCSDGPAAPGGPFNATWSGVIVDSAAGAGTARLALTQSGAGLSGTYTTSFSDAAFDRAGSVSGTATSTAASVSLTPGTPVACAGFTLSGTMGGTVAVTGARLTGNYVALACNGAVSGTLDLTRQ